MSYATLMVHLQLGHANAGLLRVTGDLAERLQASVIGIAGCQPVQIVYGDGYVAGDVIEQDRDEIAKEIAAAEAEFRAALHGRASSLEWRSVVTPEPVADYLAREARSADVFVAQLDSKTSFFDISKHVDLGDIVTQIGRPVLIVPPQVDRLKLERVLVGWKDSRETRRAVVDALPLLALADHVSIVEIAPKAELTEVRERLDDVVAWFRRHGVGAEASVVPAAGDDAAQLQAVAQEQAADLIVAGAYGHSRLRERVVGGVTQDLLLRADRCALVSH